MRKMLKDQALTDIYQEVSNTHQIPLGDFPNISYIQEKFADSKLEFAKHQKVLMARLEDMLTKDIPELVKSLPMEESSATAEIIPKHLAFASPFANINTDGAGPSPFHVSQWLERPPDVDLLSKDFQALGPVLDGSVLKINGNQAKGWMTESKLPSNVLHKIWALADNDKDGKLSLQEFAVADHLIKMKLDN